MHTINRFLIALLMNFCFVAGAMAQDILPLESILNDDGSVDMSSNVRGSFNPDGFMMKYGEHGEPLFVPDNSPQRAPGDENWSDQFPGPPGAGGTVYAVAKYENSIYIGGSFQSVYKLPYANFIAKWDGSAWSSLGSGMSSFVYAVLAVGGQAFMVTDDVTETYMVTDDATETFMVAE